MIVQAHCLRHEPRHFKDLAPFQKLRAPGNRKEEWMFSSCISLLTGDDRGCMKRNEG